MLRQFNYSYAFLTCSNHIVGAQFIVRKQRLTHAIFQGIQCAPTLFAPCLSRQTFLSNTYAS
jgi:hypothetical protein